MPELVTSAKDLALLLSERIRTRLLSAGARLPSVRQCAAQYRISPSTVVSAYEQLQARGLIEAHPGRGFFVRAPAPSGQAKALGQDAAAPVASKMERMLAPVNAAALIRGMFQPMGAASQPGMGVLPPEWLDNRFLSSALRHVSSMAQVHEHSLRYGHPLGDPHFRQVQAQRLQALGLQVGAEHIISTLGATHALDLVARTLLKPGDAVLVDEPGWAVELARLHQMGMRILPVPRGALGPDLEVMERLCLAHAPKLFVSVNVLHNPTGASISPAHAHRVLQLAQRHQFYIAEDDTYGHFVPPHTTRMSVLDGLSRTIYISGYSKILAPNWRVGFMVAPAHLQEALVDAKLLSSLTTPAVLERALAHCIEAGHLHRHVQQMTVRLDAARERSVRLALAHDCAFVTPPAGLFGWVDTGVDTEALAQRMLDENILLAPGALFYAQHAPSTRMRINFATTQDAHFWTRFAQQRKGMVGS